MSVPPPPVMWTATHPPPFTVSQWQELEHQALIFKYLKAGLSVPPDLLLPIRKSLQMMSHPSLGYYGKKIDPEPGRCRRTDGKKWRCSRDAHPDSKYCDRHMIRRRYRSRKPVESQSQTQPSSTSSSSSSSQLASTTTTTTTAATSASFHTLPLHTNGTREGFSFTLGGNNNTISQMDPLLLPLQGSKKPYSTSSFQDKASSISKRKLTFGSGTKTVGIGKGDILHNLILWSSYYHYPPTVSVLAHPPFSLCFLLSIFYSKLNNSLHLCKSLISHQHLFLPLPHVMMTATPHTAFNPQFLHTHIRNNNNTWTLISGNVKSQFPIHHRSEFLHSSHKLVAPICATLRNPKGFGPSPKKKKKTKKLMKEDDEEEDEEEGAEEEGVIPEVVTNRMISRMGFSVGIPLGIGLLFFPFFYYLKVGLKIDVPTWVPFIVSFFFFGSALLGVSYGIVSSSWDPLREGSLLGWNEAQKNWPVFWQSLRGGGSRKN